MSNEFHSEEMYRSIFENAIEGISRPRPPASTSTSIRRWRRCTATTRCRTSSPA
ncbi:MAG: hypothetical protein WDO13_01250 [Verrucomicrobiota bacterium]